MTDPFRWPGLATPPPPRCECGERADDGDDAGLCSECRAADDARAAELRGEGHGDACAVIADDLEACDCGRDSAWGDLARAMMGSDDE